MSARSRSLAQPVGAGIVAAIVGFASSFPVVLSGLVAVGATDAQASSGLLVLCVTMGAVAIGLGLRLRIPVSIVWSTPGAALLVAAGRPDGGWAAAVGAFALVGLLIALTGLVRPFGRAVGAIPVPIASAMLAGVLLELCLAPVRAVVELPGRAAPIVLAWALLARFAKRWAVPGALAVAAIVIAASEPLGAALSGHAAPVLSITTPTLTAGAVLGVALPLYVVTMASQNVPGMGVLASFGFRPPLRPILASTGLASAVGAPFGGHGINLAAITAALVASPDADPDPDRRWIASAVAGATYLILGLAAGLATALLAAAPPLLVEAVAGLALLGALGGALTAATASDPHREAAIATFVVSASGVHPLSVSAPFWGLLAGLALLGLRRA